MKYVLVGLMLLLNSGCSNVVSTGPGQSTRGRINIALMVPISGTSSALGTSIAQAAKMATQDTPETQVNLEIIDTGSESALAPEALKKVKEGKFNAVIGPLFSTHTKDLEQVISKTTPIISFSNDISLSGKDNVYLAGFLPEQQVERVIKHTTMHGYKNIHALLPHNRYGEVVARTLEKGAQEQEYSLKTIAYYHDAATMHSSAQKIIDATMPRALELSEITNNTHEKHAILIPEGGSHLAEIIHYIAHNKGDDIGDVRLLGSSQWSEHDISSLPELNHGWIAAAPQAPLDDFRKRYKTAFSSDPFDIAVLGYDLTKLVAVLLQGKGNIHSELTRPEGFTGFAGTFRFIKNGANQRNLGVLEVRNLKFTEVAPSDEWF